MPLLLGSGKRAEWGNNFKEKSMNVPYLCCVDAILLYWLC